MLIFFILLLPACLLIYEFERKNPKDFIPAATGFLSSIVLCVEKVFFMYSHRIIPFSFSENFIYYLFRLYVLPVLVVYGLFFLFSKDKLEYKINSFFSLLSSFYAVYLPYSVISSYSSNVFAGYDIFIKPALVAAMLSGLAFCIKCLYLSIIDKKILFIILNVALIILLFVLPAVFDCIYLLRILNFGVLILFCIIYILLSFTGIVCAVIKK